MLKTGMKKHRIFALATIDVRAAMFSASRKPMTTIIGAMMKTFFGEFSPMAVTAAMKAMRTVTTHPILCLLPQPKSVCCGARVNQAATPLPEVFGNTSCFPKAGFRKIISFCT